MDAYFRRLADLARDRAVFATATIVGRQSPVSSHLGDRAIIFADGRMEGFVGGSCSRDIVRRQALRAIETGKPRLLQIRPDASAATRSADAETFIVPMGCASEGAADVYIEPHGLAEHLLVAGFTPVAEMVVRLGTSLSYEVTRIVDRDERADVVEIVGVKTLVVDELRAHIAALTPSSRGRTVAVVASQGHYDEAVLDVILSYAELPYVGLLASRKRAASVFGVLTQQGCTNDQLARIRNPIGLDLGARTPGDVAVSIFAEIVSVLRTHGAAEQTETLKETAVTSAIDPVCGMEVEMATARHRLNHGGSTIYFCCAHCAAAFAEEPARYIASAAGS